MGKRPRQMNLQKLGDILQQILKKRNVLLTSEKRHLQEIWLQAVGSHIAAQASPDRLKNNSLYVKVSSPVWMQQLHFLKEEIIDKINGQIGRGSVTNIFFSIGEIPVAPHVNQSPESFFPESFPLKNSDKKMIEQSISSVTDQELKEILKRVLTRDMIRRRLSGTRKVP
jgi:hypothetical protein